MQNLLPTLTETCQFLSDPSLNGRYPSSPGHEEAKEYLRGLLPRLGLEPLFDGASTQDVLDGERIIGTNLGGVCRGRSGRSILLGAHYDHFEGIPGADDNAAALSILVDVVRQLAPWTGDHDLVLCFFDLEEPPYFCSPLMGSVQFVERCPISPDRIECAIVLDLCGHDVPVPGNEGAMFVLGAESSRDLVDVVRSQESASLPTFMMGNRRIGDRSDHHAFRLSGVPYLFFSCGQWEHYHRPTDVFENLNLDKMQRFADYLVGLVRAVDSLRISREPIANFVEEEARSLSRLGFPVPTTESAISAAVGILVSQFGG